MVMPRAAIVIDNTPRNLMGAYQPARCTSGPLRGLGRQFACRSWVLSVVLLISMARAGVAGAQVHVTESNKTADGARVAFQFDWDDPLSTFVDSSGVTSWSHPVLAAVSGGLLSVSYPLELPTKDLPLLQTVSREYDDHEVDIALDDADPWVDQPAVWASGLGTSRKRHVVNLVTMPYRLNPASGRMERLRTLVVDVSFTGAGVPMAPAARPARKRVAESVLAEGSLYRISIAEDGVYRVDRALLTTLGLDPDTIDPDQVHLFSNGGRPLPALVGADRIDDLREVPAMRSGGGDGRFDSGDQVLFYARGPSGWMWNGSGFEHFVHPFSTDNAVFLKIGSGVGSSLTIAADGSTGSAVQYASTRGRFVVDLEESLWSREHGSGHDWVSNRIRPGADRVIYSELALPGLMAGTVLYEARVAIASNPRATVAMLSEGQVLAQQTAPNIVSNDPEAPAASPAVFTFVQQVVEGQQLDLSMRLLNQANDPQAALDWVRLEYEQSLRATDDYLAFTSRPEYTGSQRFLLAGFSSMPQVWDVTDGLLHHAYFVEDSGAGFVAHVPSQAQGQRPRDMVAFTPAAIKDVAADQVRTVDNQNLHGVTSWPDLIIVTTTPFLVAAERLADHRRRQGLEVTVVTQDQVFNEFSGGVPDMRAVRDYMAFLYERTDDPDLIPSYLLLIGDGHYDYRGLSGLQSPQANHIFPFETEESFRTVASYTSDDYFGLLDPDEGEWTFLTIQSKSRERLDLGIGRLPVQTASEAAMMVDKLVRYDDPSTFGAWRSVYTAIADDGPTGLSAQQNDADLHLTNIDQVVQYIADEVYPAINLKKIYGETYERVFLNGFRIPEARRDILEAIDRGSLVVNYSGHGGPDGLAQEAIFTREDAAALTNRDQLPVMITATCSFGWWDLEEEQSGAEVMLLNPSGGAIALLTSVRLAYTSPGQNTLNAGLNRVLSREMFLRDDGLPRRLGDVLRITKNTEVGLEGNSRKFNLLGDPSMRLGLPAGQAVVEDLSGVDLAAGTGQMRALDKVRISGSVRNELDQVDTSFDGVVEVSVFDAERQIEIQERRYHIAPYFREREDLLWRGVVRAQSGRYEATFVVPKDISYTDLPGRIAVYARNESGQALGYSENFLVGGTSDSPPQDALGPEIELYIGDSTFVSGATVSGNPELVVSLYDASGINTVGTGVGHEILLTVDGNEETAVDIGSAFVAEPDSYQKGEIRWQLQDIEPGPHSVSVRAWDVLNNSNTGEISFNVADDKVLEVRNVYTYPNPMSRETRFVFEHNQQAGTPAEVHVRIFTLSGRPIRTIPTEEALPGGILGSGPLIIPWDGKDDDMDRPATGIYLYRIRVVVDLPGRARQVSEHVEKLAIIR